MMIFALAALLQVTAAPVGGSQPDATQQQPAQTETTAPSGTAAAPQPQPPRERRNCHREVVTGSRVTHMVCSSARVDADLEREGREGLERLQAQIPYMPSN